MILVEIKIGTQHKLLLLLWLFLLLFAVFTVVVGATIVNVIILVNDCFLLLFLIRGQSKKSVS